MAGGSLGDSALGVSPVEGSSPGVPVGAVGSSVVGSVVSVPSPVPAGSGSVPSGVVSSVPVPPLGSTTGGIRSTGSAGNEMSGKGRSPLPEPDGAGGTGPNASIPPPKSGGVGSVGV